MFIAGSLVTNSKKVYKTIVAYHQTRKGEDIIRVVGQVHGFTAIRKDLNPSAPMFMLLLCEVVFVKDIIIHYGNVDMLLMVCEYCTRKIFFVEKIFGHKF